MTGRIVLVIAAVAFVALCLLTAAVMVECGRASRAEEARDG